MANLNGQPFFIILSSPRSTIAATSSRLAYPPGRVPSVIPAATAQAATLNLKKYIEKTLDIPRNAWYYNHANKRGQ